MHNGFMHDWFGGHLFFMPLPMILFWGIVVVLLVWLFKSVIKKTNDAPKHSPLDIAKARYAKGEIDKTELDEIKRNIS